MQLDRERRCHSAEIFKDYIGLEKPDFKPIKTRIKMPSMMNIDDKEKLFVEFLKVNNITDSDFFDEKDIEYLKLNGKPDQLPLIKRRLELKLKRFASTKDKFLQEIFETGECKQKVYQKIFKNIHHYYLLRTLLNTPSHTGMIGPSLKKFANESKLYFSNTDMDAVMKPVKCRICYSFVPVWLYVEHSNNCFGLHSLKKELLKINQTILGLCDNIKEQASKIDYEQIVKNKKEALELEKDKSNDKQRLNDSLRKSFSSKQTKPISSTNTPRDDPTAPGNTKDGSMLKNGAPSKSIFNSYKNENKMNANDPSFTARVKFLKQRSDIFEEIRSVNAKHTVTPSVNSHYRSRGDQGSKTSKAPNNVDSVNASPDFSYHSSKHKVQPKKLKKVKLGGRDSDSSEIDGSKEESGKENEENKGLLVGDMFGDDDIDSDNSRRNKNPFETPAFGRNFPKKTMTEYKSYKNTFNLDIDELKGFKKIDSQNATKHERLDQTKNPTKQSIKEFQVDNKQDEYASNDLRDDSLSDNDSASPCFHEQFDMNKSNSNYIFNSKKTVKEESKGFDLNTRIKKFHTTESEAKKEQKLINNNEIYFNNVFSFKNPNREEDDSIAKETKKSNLNLQMFPVQEEHGKTSIYVEANSPQLNRGRKLVNIQPLTFQSFRNNNSSLRAKENESHFKEAPVKLNDIQRIGLSDDSVSSKEMDISLTRQKKRVSDDDKDMSGSEDSDDPIGAHTPPSPSNTRGRDTFQTFGRNSQNVDHKIDRNSIFQFKKLSNFPRAMGNGSLNEEDECENPSLKQKSSNDSCVGDLFDQAFGTEEPTQTKSTKINTILMNKSSKKNDKKERGPNKQDFENDMLGSGSRNSFTTTVKHSSFYHLHRNSVQNVSLNLNMKINENDQSHSSSASNSRNKECDENKDFSIDCKGKSGENNQNIIEDVSTPMNYINKNFSIVKESWKNMQSNEELNRLGSLISKSHMEQPLQMASRTSLCLDHSGNKHDYNSEFKESAGDLSPITRPHNYTKFDDKSKENTNNIDCSHFAIIDITIDKKDQEKSILAEVGGQPELQKPVVQNKLIRANSKVNVWKAMHKTSTDYRKVTATKEDNFDEYYMYLFNKEVQKYKECLLTNPYMQNFFADQEIAKKIEEYKDKIKKQPYLDVINSLQAAVFERMETVKESRKFQNNIEDITKQTSSQRLVREKFSRSFCNISVLETSYDSLQNMPQIRVKNKDNFLLEKACVNSSKRNNLPSLRADFNGKESLHPFTGSSQLIKKLSINVQNNIEPIQQDLRLPVTSSKLPINFAKNTAFLHPNAGLNLLKMPSKLSSQHSSELPLKTLQDSKTLDLKGSKNSNLFKTTPNDMKENEEEDLKQRVRLSDRRTSLLPIRRCQSDSEFLIQSEKEKIYIEKTRNISMEDFNILKELGKGAYGKVYLVAKKSTQDIFAMKIIKFSQKTSPQFLQNLQNEISILGIIKGDFLAHAYFSFVQNHCLCIVMEYLVGGDFREMLTNEGRFDNNVAQHYIAQLVIALEELHENKIVHRDLKPENLLLDIDGKLKLADFGLSEFYAKIDENNDVKDTGSRGLTSELTLAKNIVGTPDYIPPEIFLGYDYCERQGMQMNDKVGTIGAISNITGDKNAMIGHDSDAMTVHTLAGNIETVKPERSTTMHSVPTTATENEKLANAIDWWAVGCLLYEFCIGVSPFAGMTPDEVFANIKKYKLDWPDVGYEEDCITPEAKDLIEKLLDINPKTRLGTNSSESIKAHPFFATINWDTLVNEKPPIPVNFTLPNKKSRVKMSMALEKHKNNGNESFMETDDLTMNRVDLLFEMNIKQFKNLK